MGPMQTEWARTLIHLEERSGKPSHERLKFIAKNFRYSPVAEPETRDRMAYTRTIGIIQEIFPMYELTLDGLDKAVST